jgi:hypothetical protein
MASTTLMPLDPALSPQRVARVLTISANLLPDEIVGARRARRSRGWVVVALIVVVVLLACWYVWAVGRVRAAGEELGHVTGQATALQKSQTRYQEVVDIQNETMAISRELKALLANDLPWATLLDTLRKTGDASGIEVTGISALLTDTTNTKNTSETLPSTTSASSVGTVTVTGTGPDKPSVAKYVDALGKLSIVANPYLTNATEGEKEWQFSVTVDVTSTTRCGRFSTKCKTAGGN